MRAVEAGVVWRVGCVPYVNAMPLVDGLPPEVAVTFDVPSCLPPQLESGTVDAVLVSSVYALRQRGARASAGVGIVSDGPVESVRLFLNVAPESVHTLSLDPASMTSNLLAQLVLKEVYGSAPATTPGNGRLDSGLSTADAAVLIGDAGMTAEGSAAQVIDLGHAWTDWTGLPFVWALWTGFEGLDADLACRLASSPSTVRAGRGELLDDAYVHGVAARCGWPTETVRRYLGETMVYRVGPREEEGLREFASRLEAAGLVDGLGLPEWVRPSGQEPGTIPDPGPAQVPVGM